MLCRPANSHRFILLLTLPLLRANYQRIIFVLVMRNIETVKCLFWSWVGHVKVICEERLISRQKQFLILEKHYEAVQLTWNWRPWNLQRKAGLRQQVESTKWHPRLFLTGEPGKRDSLHFMKSRRLGGKDYFWRRRKKNYGCWSTWYFDRIDIREMWEWFPCFA